MVSPLEGFRKVAVGFLSPWVSGRALKPLLRQRGGDVIVILNGVPRSAGRSEESRLPAQALFLHYRQTHGRKHGSPLHPHKINKGDLSPIRK